VCACVRSAVYSRFALLPMWRNRADIILYQESLYWCQAKEESGSCGSWARKGQGCVRKTPGDHKGAHHSQIYNFTTGSVYSSTGYPKVQWSNLDPYALKNLDKEDSVPVMLTNEETSTA
jgi:hypothetical protein